MRRSHSNFADRLGERYWLATSRVNSFWLAYLEGDWAAARKLSDAGLQLQPRDVRNLGLRALLECQLGRAAEGETYLERLLAVMRATNPGSTVEHSEAAATVALVGRITGRNERFDVAEAAAKTVLSASIRIPIFDLHARIGLGVLAAERSDAAAAEEQYRELESQSGTVLDPAGNGRRPTARAARSHHGQARHRGCPLRGRTVILRSIRLPSRARAEPHLDYADALRQQGPSSRQGREADLRAEALAVARAVGMLALEERIVADVRGDG